MYDLGVMYDNGLGVEESDEEAEEWYPKAEEWYQKAAEQGLADAQYKLGDMYHDYYYNDGDDYDYEEARE